MARKVLINLTTGLEDPERVTVAFLVGGAAIERGEIVAMWLTRRRCASRCPDTPRRSHATAARHSRDCLSSTPTAAARSWSVRSAGTPASSTRAPWFRTPASPAQHPCSNGSGMIKPRSSATDRGARAPGVSDGQAFRRPEELRRVLIDGHARLVRAVTSSVTCGRQMAGSRR